VRCKPAIYNTTYKNNKDSQYIENVWASIAGKLNKRFGNKKSRKLQFICEYNIFLSYSFYEVSRHDHEHPRYSRDVTMNTLRAKTVAEC